MQKNKADYTNTFRALSFDQPVDELSCSEEFNEWHRQWQARLNRQEGSKESSRELMQQTNPAIIPRNHKVEEALEAAGEEISVLCFAFLMFCRSLMKKIRIRNVQVLRYLLIAPTVLFAEHKSFYERFLYAVYKGSVFCCSMGANTTVRCVLPTFFNELVL
nr:protein adenylyltransferase SelO family protein [Alteribacter keqinensis]